MVTATTLTVQLDAFVRFVPKATNVPTSTVPASAVQVLTALVAPATKIKALVNHAKPGTTATGAYTICVGKDNICDHQIKVA